MPSFSSAEKSTKLTGIKVCVMKNSQKRIFYSTTWVKYFKINPYSLLFCWLIGSCNQSNPSSPRKDNNPAGTFKPNPKKSEHQEVRTLTTGETAPSFNLPDITGKFYP